MRIDGPGRSNKVNSSGGARKSSGSGPAFSVGGNEAPNRASATGQAGPVTGLDAILALQAVEDPLFAKRKLVKRGASMLDVLEEMKVDLLAGRVNEQSLSRLLALVQQARVKADPALEGLIDEIDLRARVELAKLGRFPGF